MRSRTLLLTLLLLVVLVPPSATAQSEAPDQAPGVYPGQVRALVMELVENAEDDTSPPGPASEATQVWLDAARRAIGNDRLGEAIDAYITFRVHAANEHVVDQAGELSPQEARRLVTSFTERFGAEARASASQGRAVVNAVPPSELTTRGAETALWGAFLVAQGEQQINRGERLPLTGVFQEGSVIPATLRTHILLSHGAATRIAVGAAIASLAPHIPGPAADTGALVEGLERFADLSTPAGVRSDVVQDLPRGNQTRDGPVMRAALNLLAKEQLEGIEARRTFVTVPSAQQRADLMRQGLASDRGDLARWAAADSALALAAYERVNTEVPERLSNQQVGSYVTSRAFARNVIQAEELVSPDTPEAGNGTPLGVLAVLGGVLLATLVATRGRPRR